MGANSQPFFFFFFAAAGGASKKENMLSASRPLRGAISKGGAATSFEDVFSGVLQSCRVEMTAYGSCVGRNLAHLDKGVCSREFAAFKSCSEALLAKRRQGGK